MIYYYCALCWLLWIKTLNVILFICLPAMRWGSIALLLVGRFDLVLCIVRSLPVWPLAWLVGYACLP